MRRFIERRADLDAIVWLERPRALRPHFIQFTSGGSKRK